MNTDKLQKMLLNEGIVFLAYGEFITQTLITGMTEILEAETEKNNMSMGVSSNIFTVFIELAQNIMHYTDNNQELKNNNPEVFILIKKDDENYYIHSQNTIYKSDKEYIEPILSEVVTLSKDEIKKKYKELRRSGKNSHAKGGGIGFYEIAKRSEKVEFKFTELGDEKFSFHFVSIIKIKKEK